MENRSRQPEPLYGATDPDVIIPMDRMERSFVDEIADNYDVSLEYDEGEVYVHGTSSEEVQDFVNDIYSTEKKMEGKDHPTSGFLDAEFSIVSALESEVDKSEVDRGKGIVTDGGRENYQTLEDISHRHENYDGVQESMNRGKKEEHEKIADGGEEITGIPLAGFPSEVEMERVNDSESYMGTF